MRARHLGRGRVADGLVAAAFVLSLALGQSSWAQASRLDGGAAAAANVLTLERNKQLVADLFEIINHGSTADLGKLDQIVAVDYIQHNPRAEQGREGLRRFLALLMSLPERELKPEDSLSVRLIAEGDMVVRQDLRGNGMLIDIFRVRDGKLQEHWDAFRFAPGAKPIPGF